MDDIWGIDHELPALHFWLTLTHLCSETVVTSCINGFQLLPLHIGLPKCPGRNHGKATFFAGNPGLFPLDQMSELDRSPVF